MSKADKVPAMNNPVDVLRLLEDFKARAQGELNGKQWILLTRLATKVWKALFDAKLVVGLGLKI